MIGDSARLKIEGSSQKWPEPVVNGKAAYPIPTMPRESGTARAMRIASMRILHRNSTSSGFACPVFATQVEIPQYLPRVHIQRIQILGHVPDGETIADSGQLFHTKSL